MRDGLGTSLAFRIVDTPGSLSLRLSSIRRKVSSPPVRSFGRVLFSELRNSVHACVSKHVRVPAFYVARTGGVPRLRHEERINGWTERGAARRVLNRRTWSVHYVGA